MEIELILLGCLFLMGCVIDYIQLKDELRDQNKEDEEDE